MSRARGPDALRALWLLATVILFSIIMIQLDEAGDRVEDLLGWFGATTGAVLVLALFGAARRDRQPGSDRGWLVTLAIVLSLLHIAASIWTLRRVSEANSLTPLEQSLPLFGALNPLVLAALAGLFRASAVPGAVPPADAPPPDHDPH